MNMNPTLEETLRTLEETLRNASDEEIRAFIVETLLELLARISHEK